MKFSKWFFVLCAVLVVAGVAVSQQQKRKKKGRAVLSIPDVGKKDLICFALYTVHDRTLKLTAQLYPLGDAFFISEIILILDLLLSIFFKKGLVGL